MGVVPACMPVHYMCAWYLRRQEEDIRFLGTRVIDSCEHHVNAINQTQAFGEAATVLTAEPSFQPNFSPFKI